MGYRRESEPSPIRTGIVHAGMSLAVFGGLAASLGLGIHVVADPGAASPVQTIALFDTFDAPVSETVRAASLDDPGTYPGSGSFPELDSDEDGEAFELAAASLGSEPARIEVTGGQGGPEIGSDTIRINGRIVRSGESLSQVRRVPQAETGAIRIASATTSPVASPKTKSKSPADIYARRFSNPEGRPMVGLVIGGLGMNATQTQLAIDDLPADVTLSFALDSKRLDHWIKTARADGHEVLIEVPMEAYDYGRMKMHPDTLLAGADAKINLSRLDAVLSRTTGYFGIVNYQGAKFAADKASANPVLKHLGEKGLAFVDDGSFERTSLESLARANGLRYARAAGPIDTRQTPADISAELMELESLALEKGAAFGSGYGFPVTVEAAKVWISQLDEKGLILAPVSAIINERPSEVRTGSLDKSGLFNGG
jgi:hypothetical protein